MGKLLVKLEIWKIKFNLQSTVMFYEKKNAGKTLIVFSFMFFILVKDNFMHIECP